MSLFDATLATARAPVNRDVGTYTVRVANTVWRLTGFAVETPDTDGSVRFAVGHRDLTTDEKKDCAGEPEDSTR